MSFFRSRKRKLQPPGAGDGGDYESILPEQNSLPSGTHAGLGPGRLLPPRKDNNPHERRSYVSRLIRRLLPFRRTVGDSFVVVECPSPALAMTNCLSVNPSDFPTGIHVMVNSRFPFTTKHDDTGTLSTGQVGASASQRRWMRLIMSGGDVTVSSLKVSPAEIYLKSLDLAVGFWKHGPDIAEQFSSDEMTKSFIKAFNGEIFGLYQELEFDFHGQNLMVIVVGLKVLELAGGRRRGKPGGAAASGMGILMDRTDVACVKLASRSMRIKRNKARINAIFAPSFKFEDMGIGGLDTEFSQIFRRAFASRMFPLDLVDKLGIQHVKGILLFGPPGTGKTLMARQIGKTLKAREPKIANGPEILNKFVGASEDNIRKLFADAEQEYEKRGDQSGLHIIIFDELDAICTGRGSDVGVGAGVRDRIVNQLLSKMDDLNQLNNILLIGITNRLDLIDEALLRPGRLEVHIEIPLPDEHGRHQILTIQTAKMCTDGVMENDVDLKELALQTKNFSGAEIGGLVKSATSFAFSRHVKVGTVAGISDDIENLCVNRQDFRQALDEFHPAFGVSEEELEQAVQNGIIHFDNTINALLHDGSLFVEQVRSSMRTPLVSILLHGPPGSGKTALAATIAQASQFPFIKLVSLDSMVGLDEAQQVAKINKVFVDSYKTSLSLIIIDSIERLIGWAQIDPLNESRFSNAVLQALLVLLQRRPPKGRRLLIICTTSILPILTDLQMSEIFDAALHVPPITALRSLEYVLREVELFSNSEGLHRVIRMIEQAGAGDADGAGLQIGIKKLLTIIEIARQDPDKVAERFVSALMGFIV